MSALSELGVTDVRTSTTSNPRQASDVMVEESGLNNQKVLGKRKAQDQGLEGSDGESQPNGFATPEQGTRPTKRQPTTENREEISSPSSDQNTSPGLGKREPSVIPFEARRERSVIVIDDSESEYAESEADVAVKTLEKVNTPRAGKPSEQNKRKNALNRTIRDALYALGGWETARDVLPTQKGKNGRPIFWTIDSRGRKTMTPAWDLGFDKNWDEWGPTFLETFRLKANRNVCADYLAEVGDNKVRLRFKESTWICCRKIGRARNREARQGNRVGVDESQGRKSLLLARAEARVGTCLESEEFDSLFTLSAQSPEVSDAEDDSRVTRLEPRWLSSKVVEIKSSLDQRSKLGSTKELDVSYTKHDVPMKQPGGGMRYPYWAIDKNWMRDYPAEFEKSKFMIDMRATTKPDTSSLARDYGTIPRNYAERPSLLVQKGSNDNRLPGPAGSNIVAPSSDKTLPVPQPQAFFLLPASIPAGPSGSMPQPMHMDPQVLMHFQAIPVAGAPFLVPAGTPTVYHSAPGQTTHNAQPHIQPAVQYAQSTGVAVSQTQPAPHVAEASASSPPTASSSQHQS